MTNTQRDRQVAKLKQSRDAKRKKWGDSYASLGNQHYTYNVVPTASLMLDYKMGIGGAPYGHAIEVFGANTLGKTSIMGYTTVANVQKQGKLPAIIAVEPVFDYEWAAKFGVDPELLLVQRPDNAEQAFEMLRELVYENLVDYILFDSIGALAAESETGEDGKRKAFGVSGIVTSGLNSVMPRLWRNNIGLMLLNQQRQDTKSRGNVGQMNYDSPGGEALHHDCVIRIQLKPGKNRYTQKIDGEDVLVGRELICDFKKNKLAMNARKASFDFFHVPTLEYGFGVDTTSDYMNTGMVTGVIGGTQAWPEHHTFPKGKLHGKPAVSKFLKGHPEAMEIIRNEVLAKMTQEQIEAREMADKALEEREVTDDGE